MGVEKTERAIGRGCGAFHLFIADSNPALLVSGEGGGGTFSVLCEISLLITMSVSQYTPAQLTFLSAVSAQRPRIE